MIGVKIGVHTSVEEAGLLDTVVSSSEQDPGVFTPEVIDAVKVLAPRSKRVASIYTDAFVVAVAGPLVKRIRLSFRHHTVGVSDEVSDEPIGRGRSAREGGGEGAS